MAAGNPLIDGLPDQERRALDSLVENFDRRWDDGRLSIQAGRIPPGAPWRLPALIEMVRIDLERQWRAGREIDLETYLRQFPELGQPGDIPADLILLEFDVRRRFGASASLEDYLRRFPAQAGELARLIASGRSLGLRDPALPSSAGVVAPSNSPATPVGAPPERLGRYRIIKRLGQGGMGSVYLAEDTQLGRRVALKVPHFGPDDGTEARERFFREARTAATLDHPYLCPVYDVGEVDGRLYLTMAFIEGKSLAESLRGEGMPVRQVAALVGKLALALQQAHSKGIVHRDLKPANVMIKTEGKRREPVIVDFGLALRDDTDDSRITKSGQVMGTLAYMAPEQVMGDLKKIGPASDIYALGVILYELLTGQLPFNGSGLAIAGQILTQTPLPLHSLRPEIDRRIEAICLKAMAKNIGDRHASMSVLAAELTGFLQAPAATSSPPDVQPTAKPRAGAAPSSRTGHESLVAQLFEGLAAEDDASAAKQPKPRSRAPKAEPEPEILPPIDPDQSPGRARPRWVWSAVGAAVALLGAVVAWIGSGGPVETGQMNIEPIVATPTRLTELIPPPNSKPKPKIESEKVRESTQPTPPLPPGAAVARTPKPPPMIEFQTSDTRPTLLASYRAVSPVADGVISADEYRTGVEVNFASGSRFGSIAPIGSDPSLTKEPADLSVQLFAAYTEKDLFLAFHVRDQFIDGDEADMNTPQMNDAVELFIDGDRVANDFNIKSRFIPSSSAEGFQLMADVAGHQYTSPTDFTSANWKVGTNRVSDGYVIEFAIPLPLIDVSDGPPRRQPGPGSLIHLGVALDDSDAPGNTKRSYAYLRARANVLTPFFGREDAWTLGLRLEPKPPS